MIQIKAIQGTGSGWGYKVQLRIFWRRLHFMFMLWQTDEFGDDYSN